MYEESKRTGWLNFLIKAIIAVIFILFVVWLFSLTTKGLSNSVSEYGKKLDVLTDTITTDNFSRLEQVGKNYFTTERLPKNTGDVEKVTLKELYEKNLILEVKDKNGNACSNDNSYISVTKLESEYQMKIYLECGDKKDFVLVDMGCYDTCIDCNKEEEKIVKKVTQYQYKKTTDGKWSDYGAWSNWSTNKVIESTARQVETKSVVEKYTVNEQTTRTLKEKATCPSGYSLSGNECIGVKTSELTCPSGYSLSGTSCIKTTSIDPVCKTGYTRNGVNCTKTTYADPVCPEGYIRNGSTCTKTLKTDPKCPNLGSEYDVTRDGFNCTYTKTVETEEKFIEQRNGTYMPSDTSVYRYEKVSIRDQLDCNNSCKKVTIYTYNVYKKATSTTETKTGKATCPTGYSVSGNNCITTTTKGATCTTGSLSNEKCVSTSKETATCTTGSLSNGKCVSTSITGATCKEGSISNGACTLSISTKPSCKVGYTLNGQECSKVETITVPVERERTVVYYRERTRSYTGGTVSYKWSNSKTDKNLLNQGYKLTGKTRTISK